MFERDTRSKSLIFKRRRKTSSDVGANDHFQDRTWKSDVDKSFPVLFAGQTYNDQNIFYSV